jgi:hypothetical protein
MTPAIEIDFVYASGQFEASRVLTRYEDGEVHHADLLGLYTSSDAALKSHPGARLTRRAQEERVCGL